MGAPNSKATTEEVFAAFHTEEPFKAVAKRLGMSPNTLRRWWKAEFGDEAYKARGKAIQAKAAAKTSRATATTRTYKETSIACSKCGSEAKVRVTSIVRLKDPTTFVCDQCRGDRDCPVCGLRVDGKRGLSAHFAHRREAGDEAHLLYEGMVEDARWSSRVEDEDYVRCRECGLRATTLATHLKAAHGLTADEYRAKHGDALIRSRALTRKRAEAIQAGRSSPAYEGTKTIVCPSCGASREESKFFAPAYLRGRLVELGVVCRVASDPLDFLDGVQ
jgi:rubrerythrin